MGSLTFRGDAIYRFSDADRDLLVRALFGEAGGASTSTREGLAIICCMVQRWAMFLTLPWYRVLLRKKPDAKVYGYDTFSDMLAAYSQPVNPKWLNGGRFDRDPEHIDTAELRRDWLQTRAISSFPGGVRSLVSSALDGDSLRDGVPADMAGLVHFYCPAVYYARKVGAKLRHLADAEVDDASREAFGHGPDKIIWSQPANVSARSNAFYKVPRTKRWTRIDVKVIP